MPGIASRDALLLDPPVYLSLELLVQLPADLAPHERRHRPPDPHYLSRDLVHNLSPSMPTPRPRPRLYALNLRGALPVPSLTRCKVCETYHAPDSQQMHSKVQPSGGQAPTSARGRRTGAPCGGPGGAREARSHGAAPCALRRHRAATRERRHGSARCGAGPCPWAYLAVILKSTRPATVAPEASRAMSTIVSRLGRMALGLTTKWS